MKTLLTMTILTAAFALTGCAEDERPPERRESVHAAGTVYTVPDTLVAATFDASGVAEPMQRATLSTKLTGTVISVRVREGDVVQAGQVLATLDARDLVAKDAQIAAALAEAQAVQGDAETQAGRMRALYADSAATRVQLDAAETGLARANATVRASLAAAEELRAVSAYATVRAPFAGTVTRRLVDPGAFAAPGSPIVMLEDASRLPPWERACPLRALLTWWAAPERLLMAHGAAVGSGEGALLLAGPGGSGKSTTALACFVEPAWLWLSFTTCPVFFLYSPMNSALYSS